MRLHGVGQSWVTHNNPPSHTVESQRKRTPHRPRHHNTLPLPLPLSLSLSLSLALGKRKR